ncbi:MAG TPA: Uma2 family endonuclease [Niastella sp.]
MEKKTPPEHDNKKRYYTVEEYLEFERKSNVKHEYYKGEIFPLGDSLEHSIIINEPAVDYTKQRYTIEEYLEMERASDIKHEYYQGEIFAMAGAGPGHNLIFSNVFGELYVSLKGKPCRPYGSDMRIHIPENTLFCYPDISIFCGEPITTDKEKDSVLHPTIIIEIMSKSTRSYDQTTKFDLYRDIPTLKEYILIDSESIGVKSYRIDADNRWVLEEYKTLQDIVLIPTVGVSLSMKDIYDGVVFT